MEDQPVKVIGQIGQREFRLGFRRPDGPDEQAKSHFGVERMLHRRPYQWLFRVGLGGRPRPQFPAGLRR